MEQKLYEELRKQGAAIFRTADINSLPAEKRKGYPRALVIGIPLSQAYLMALIDGIEPECHEFGEQEHHVQEVAEWAAQWLQDQEWQALAMTDDNCFEGGFFDESAGGSILPHKTIAGLAGLGWIGRNALMVTPEYGCAFCMCTVLTDAPLQTEPVNLVASQCGDCMACIEACPEHALTGNDWSQETNRDALLDINHCTCCLQCLIRCPWTMLYAQKAGSTFNEKNC